METNSFSQTSTFKFFVLTFVISIPFWVLSSVTGIELLPGLPIAALMTVCPLTAAAILRYRAEGVAGVKALLKRSFDLDRTKAKIWILPTLLIMPVIATLSFIVLRLSGSPVPDPRISLTQTLILCVVFFISALGEELGWSGYAIDAMQERWGALEASLILGMIWAGYHYIALAEAHRSLLWIVEWSLGTVTARIIIVWLYNNTGRSVFVTALFHMTINLTWQLFPVSGSYFDPGISGLFSLLLVIIIVFIWESQTFTRTRTTSRQHSQ